MLTAAAALTLILGPEPVAVRKVTRALAASGPGVKIHYPRRAADRAGVEYAPAGGVAAMAARTVAVSL